MYQAATFCWGWAKHENSESFQFDSISWNSPELFIEFICSCNCCNCEVSCWMVSWFSVILESRTHQLVVLALSSFFPFRAYFEATYIEELSCHRVCSRRDSTHSFCTSCSVLFWSCLIQQVIFIAFEQSPTQIRQIDVSKHRTPHLVSLFITSWWKQCSRFLGSSLIFWRMTRLCTYFSLLNDHCNWFPRSSLGIQWWSQQLL